MSVEGVVRKVLKKEGGKVKLREALLAFSFVKVASQPSPVL